MLSRVPNTQKVLINVTTSSTSNTFLLGIPSKLLESLVIPLNNYVTGDRGTKWDKRTREMLLEICPASDSKVDDGASFNKMFWVMLERKLKNETELVLGNSKMKLKFFLPFEAQVHPHSIIYYESQTRSFWGREEIHPIHTWKLTTPCGWSWTCFP